MESNVDHLTKIDMVASTFRLAVKQYFASSALYSTLAAKIAEDVDVLEIAALSKPGQFPPYLLLAAVHSLLIEFNEDMLAKFYPSITGESVPKDDPYPAFKEFTLKHADEIIKIIQTANVNKTVIKRSACLRALLVTIAKEWKWDNIHLVDIGCGAGFNLLMDHWRINYCGFGSVGPDNSPVRFSTEMRGDNAPPLFKMPNILSRTGIDPDIFDLTDKAQQFWILGCLTPDHTDTFLATRQAIPVLLKQSPDITAGDAGMKLREVLDDLPEGEPVIIMQSLINLQMNVRQKIAVKQAIQQGSLKRRIARICMDIHGTGCLLAITQPEGAEFDVYGEADYDANWMRWLV